MSEQNNNPIRKSIDNIEPAEGARERMLRNIKQKAANQQPVQAEETKSRKPIPFGSIMKWALPAAACFAVLIVGISVIPKQNTPPVDSSEGVMVGNPFGDDLTAEELQEQLGFSVDLPEEAENAAYNILDGNIANISFEYGGSSYLLRASKQSGDFSGINGTLIKSDKIDAANDAVLETIRGTDYNYFKLTWTDGAVTYILANNTEISAEDITEIYEKIKSKIVG
ncbi:MAG: hypothetical protein ACI4JZ_07145 [Oscillospiraceae bacterium]